MSTPRAKGYLINAPAPNTIKENGPEYLKLQLFCIDC